MYEINDWHEKLGARSQRRAERAAITAGVKASLTRHLLAG
jgi:hypothetical protein